MGSAELIRQECDDLCAMLLEKNRRYGDSALHPIRLFSRADAVEQIRVRIDDKTSRSAMPDGCLGALCGRPQGGCRG